MSPTALCAIMLVAAIDYGYESMGDGGICYLIRIEPHMVDLLNRGQVFGSDIPPEVAGRVRAFRVYSSEEPASKTIPPAPVEKPPAPDQPPPAAARPAVEAPRSKPPAAPPALREMFLAPQALSPSEEVPRQLPRTEKVEQAVALTPEKPSWPAGDIERQPSLAAERGDLAPKPYLPLIVAVLVAAGSSTGMLYFGWLAFDYRARYRSLLRQMLGSDQPAPALAGRLADELSAGMTGRESPETARLEYDRDFLGEPGKGDRQSPRQERAEGPRGNVREWLESDDDQSG